jgi:putative membrane protein
MMILATAFLAVACDAPGGREANQVEGEDIAAAPDAGMAAPQDEASMATPVSSGAYIAQAANADLYEIQAGELAAKNGQSQRVKEFARMMVDDHTRSAQEMKALVGQGDFAVPVPARLDAEHQAMIDRLKGAKGEAFDREYLSQQTTAHSKALALHQSYAQAGDNAELQGFARKVVPVVQKHSDWLRDNASDGPARGVDMETRTDTGAAATAERAPRATGTPSNP